MRLCSVTIVSDSVTLWTVARKAPLQISPGKNTGVGCHFLLQISPTQGSNLLSCIGKRMDSLAMSHQGSPCHHTFIQTHIQHGESTEM